ncbi:unnamed protein product [Closterium sp. Yama58-4]|nr:unnamed protein product [Closterium sp. Yama58-4]
MASAVVDHPYYPLDIAVPNYSPSGWSVEALFGVFGAAVVLVIAVSWLFTRSCRHMSALDRAIFCWWAVTGSIHLVLEATFVAFPDLMSSTSNAFLLDAWKEYSKADSRYATRDGCVLSVEAVTAFIEGPACFLILYAVVARKPFSPLLQFAVSLGQLYGDVIYFATSFLEGSKHCHPAPIYFWVAPALRVPEEARQPGAPRSHRQRCGPERRRCRAQVRASRAQVPRPYDWRGLLLLQGGVPGVCEGLRCPTGVPPGRPQGPGRLQAFPAVMLSRQQRGADEEVPRVVAHA